MCTKSFQRNEKGALEILDEAAHFLRFAPVEAFLLYYIGSLPFVLGFLFFCTDMGCSATARGHLAGASLGLAALYVWMKCWQAAFCSRLQEVLDDASSSCRGVRRIARLVCVQSAVMPWSLPCLAFASIILLPLGWCHAFFQNVTAIGTGEADVNTTLRRARRQSLLWPAQNHKLMLILPLFYIFAFLNICLAAWFIPVIMRVFLGIDFIVTKDSLFFLNATFLLSMGGIVYLCVNPLIRAAYILRCYYGESLESGLDLLTETKRLRASARKSAALFVALLAFWVVFPGRAEASLNGAHAPRASIGQARSVPAKELDSAISSVMERLEFTWRFPSEKSVEKRQDGFLSQAMGTLGRWLDKFWTWLKGLAEDFSNWLNGVMPEREVKPSTLGILGNRRFWLIFLPSCAALFLAWLVRGFLLRRRAEAHAESPQTPFSYDEPDLGDESTSAEELPSAQWSSLAWKLLEKGETRFALRAFYFATLAGLAEKELLTVSRCKSNRDYEREIARRAHFSPALAGAFCENVSILERIWYGSHAVEVKTVDKFLANYRGITGNAQQ